MNKALENIVIILVSPQMGENIGSTARAMLNMGLKNLRLVSPRDGWPNEKATATASKAYTVLDNIKVYDSVKEATADINFVLGTTARQRDMEKIALNTRQAGEEIKAKAEDGQKCAVLFGCEKSGLDNDSVAICNRVINIETNPEFSSLNLSQAVLVMVYEIFQNLKDNNIESAQYKDKPSVIAPKEEFDNFFERLVKDLEDKNYFKNEDQKHAITNLRNIFLKADLTEQEIRTLFEYF